MREVRLRFVGAVSLLPGVLAIASLLSSDTAARQVVDLATEADAVRIDGIDEDDVTGARAAVCDVNGDGIEDLVFSASEADGVDNTRSNAGEAYVLFGRRGSWKGPLNLATDADIRIVGQDRFDSIQGVGCEDVDGDGFGDLVLGSRGADSVNESRPSAGQIHILFGAPALPPLIDLAVTPGTILYGAVADTRLGQNLVVGDINGDGIADVVGDAFQGWNKAGTVVNSGRIHVVFGRPSWPASMDLLTASDVVIYGDDGDGLGVTLAVRDLDDDGIEDLAAGAPAGDGPGDSRTNAGEVHVFRGRVAWPTEIDLAVSSPDMVIYGADPSDETGRPAKALGSGDVDGDGVVELLVGASDADGRNEDMPFAGETKIVEPGSELPSELDLRTDYKTVVYGANTDDVSGMTLDSGDLNGDGRHDLAIGAENGDGPAEARSGAGEVSVFWGRRPFPPDRDLGLHQEDLIVYGASVDDRMSARTMGDLNGDGVREIVVATNEPSHTRIPALWLVSPVDTDEDTVGNLPDDCARVFDPGQEDADGDLLGDACDNCPSTANADQSDLDEDGFGDVCDSCPGQPGAESGDPDGDGLSSCFDNCAGQANPGQGDSDGDGVGDVCDVCPGDAANDPDGDGVCGAEDDCLSVFNPVQRDRDGDGVGDLCDLCPTTSDPGQGDSDGDGAGDACDCQPADPRDHRPPGVAHLHVTKVGGAAARVFWTSAAGGEAYSASRGTLAQLAQGSYGTCLAQGLDRQLDDAELPSPGQGFFYLVQAQDFDCGLGTAGYASSEQERVTACTGHPHSDAHPVDERSVYGTVSGTFTATQASDDTIETITETLSSGSPGSRFSRLEQRWTFQVPVGARVELHVEGSRSSSADGDDFAFEWSTDQSTWTRVLLPSLPLADADRDLLEPLPSGLSGTVTIRVVDTDRSAGHQGLDSVSMDELFVRSVP